MSMFLLSFIMCFSLSATADIDLNAHNIVPNPSFENGSGSPDYWGSQCRENCGVVEFLWDNTEAHTGTRSVKIYSNEIDNTCWGVWKHNLSVRGGIKWYFSSWMKAEEINYGGMIGWLWIGSNPEQTKFGKADGTCDWQFGETVWDIDSGVSSLALGMEFRRADGSGWADDVMAVPYFIKLTSDLEDRDDALSPETFSPALGADYNEWVADMNQLITDFSDWQSDPLGDLISYETEA